MLTELSVKKLSHVAFVEVKAKHFEDNYKELCMMIDYMIKDSYSIRLESLDIDGRFAACFSSDKLEEIVKKAIKYAEDENGMEWCFEGKDGSIRYEEY